MYRFWRLSRWCLIVTWLGALFFRPLLGLSVYSAYEAFLASLFGSALLWLIIVSFWSPLAARFTISQGGSIVP
jgi:hypothetical protein